jgi:hypothetical protein
MKTSHQFTRLTVIVVWCVAGIALAIWSLLAFGGYALVTDSSDWLFRWVEPLIASASWDRRVDVLLGWGESLAAVAVWVTWMLGTVGLLLTSVFATLLYVRAQRALAEPQ